MYFFPKIRHSFDHQVHEKEVWLYKIGLALIEKSILQPIQFNYDALINYGMAATSKEFLLDYRLLRLIVRGYDNKYLGNMDQGIPYYQIKHVTRSLLSFEHFISRL